MQSKSYVRARVKVQSFCDLCRVIRIAPVMCRVIRIAPVMCRVIRIAPVMCRDEWAG